MTKMKELPKNKWILKLKKKDRELYGLGKKVVNKEFEDWCSRIVMSSIL